MNPSDYFGNGNWIEEKLSYSFRITRGMMNIINKGFYIYDWFKIQDSRLKQL